MAPTFETKSFVFRFADVTVREREFAIVKAGRVQQVEPKAFRVLLMLIRNPNKLIAKEELLTWVWGDAVVTENSLARNIALLRRLLGDDPREPRFIETVSSIGYRFLCNVQVFEDASGRPEGNSRPDGLGSGDSGAAAAAGVVTGAVVPPLALVDDRSGGETKDTKQAGGRPSMWLLPGGAVLAAVLAPAIWYLHRLLPPPRITQYTQITHDGHRKSLAGTDGSRLYFNQMLNANSPESVAQASIFGGEIARISVALPNPGLADVSPDGSSFLILSQNGVWINWPLWNVRILGGSVRRLGDAFRAAFSPDGNSVAYSTSDDNWGAVYLVRSDGTGAHKLASAGDVVYDIAWSPDGRIIRLIVGDKIWEMSSNGSNLHPLFPGWRHSSGRCCGRWTPDGRFFVFLSDDQIWALDERRGIFRHPSAEPVQLTAGPLRWDRPIPGKDGTRIFAEGTIPRGEISRLDANSKQFQPFLGGISAQGMSFSKDGKSVAYVSYPEGILWKVNRDGSGRVQLTDPPIEAFLPRWSPDGKQIVFSDIGLANNWTSYIVSSEGGSPRKFLPEEHAWISVPDWSPDGHKIVFASAPAGAPWAPSRCFIRVLDLDTRQVTTVPGSAGMPGALWSPDGRYLLGGDFDHLKIFDLKTQQWSELPPKRPVDSPQWSMDSRFVYFRRGFGDSGLFRVGIKGGAEEKIADLKDWQDAGWFGRWMGLDPTDAPLLLRDIGTRNIYALTLEQK
jgi:Tol biopolymer transport system component/DNA-binding winged helix-turn-helix (wHTH) protein